MTTEELKSLKVGDVCEYVYISTSKEIVELHITKILSDSVVATQSSARKDGWRFYFVGSYPTLRLKTASPKSPEQKLRESLKVGDDCIYAREKDRDYIVRVTSIDSDVVAFAEVVGEDVRHCFLRCGAEDRRWARLRRRMAPITAEQVRQLKPGDVCEYRHEDNGPAKKATFKEYRDAKYYFVVEDAKNGAFVGDTNSGAFYVRDTGNDWSNYRAYIFAPVSITTSTMSKESSAALTWADIKNVKVGDKFVYKFDGRDDEYILTVVENSDDGIWCDFTWGVESGRRGFVFMSNSNDINNLSRVAVTESSDFDKIAALGVGTVFDYTHTTLGKGQLILAKVGSKDLHFDFDKGYGPIERAASQFGAKTLKRAWEKLVPATQSKMSWADVQQLNIGDVLRSVDKDGVKLLTVTGVAVGGTTVDEIECDNAMRLTKTTDLTGLSLRSKASQSSASALQWSDFANLKCGDRLLYKIADGGEVVRVCSSAGWTGHRVSFDILTKVFPRETLTVGAGDSTEHFARFSRISAKAAESTPEPQITWAKIKTLNVGDKLLEVVPGVGAKILTVCDKNDDCVYFDEEVDGKSNKRARVFSATVLTDVMRRLSRISTATPVPETPPKPSTEMTWEKLQQCKIGDKFTYGTYTFEITSINSSFVGGTFRNRKGYITNDTGKFSEGESSIARLAPIMEAAPEPAKPMSPSAMPDKEREITQAIFDKVDAAIRESWNGQFADIDEQVLIDAISYDYDDRKDDAKAKDVAKLCDAYRNVGWNIEYYEDDEICRFRK